MMTPWKVPGLSRKLGSCFHAFVKLKIQKLNTSFEAKLIVSHCEKGGCKEVQEELGRARCSLQVPCRGVTATPSPVSRWWMHDIGSDDIGCGEREDGCSEGCDGIRDQGWERRAGCEGKIWSQI